jgi:hypothetical protein
VDGDEYTLTALKGGLLVHKEESVEQVFKLYIRVLKASSDALAKTFTLTNARPQITPPWKGDLIKAFRGRPAEQAKAADGEAAP